MSKTIKLKIVTPEGIFFEDEVQGISIPTLEGEITVLADHIPIIAAMMPGELKVKKSGKDEFFSMTRGVVEVDGKTITILTDAAERADEIDTKRAEEAKKKAEAMMDEERHGEEGHADAVAQLERALSRIKIARKRKARGRSTINQS